MPKFTERLQSAWNAFLSREPTRSYEDYGGFGYRQDRIRLTRNNAKTIVAAIYNRIALDCAMIDLHHVQCDEEGNFKEIKKTGLDNCLSLSANLDQTGRAFILDIVMSLFDEGYVAVVPTDCSDNPYLTAEYDIYKLRTGRITNWYSDKVRIDIYNERLGKREERLFPKDQIAIIENPLYAIMNEPNSTLQRLIRKLSLLDYVDEQSSSGKLDLIIQLPYVIKTESRRQQAEQRRKDIERQLSGSKYGIAYTDGTERITQLNRAVENNLWAQAKDLTAMLYNQLGLTESILNGTAKEEEMINYYNRTIDPILSFIADEMKRKFISKTARSQGQAIMYFRDPFRLIPVSSIAEIADKLTRNEILSSNEIRTKIGYKPSDDPAANELRNSNINRSDNEKPAEAQPMTNGQNAVMKALKEKNQNGE